MSDQVTTHLGIQEQSDHHHKQFQLVDLKLEKFE
jgi:hypothetical protein